MSWRTVVVSHRSKLDYKMNYLEIRGVETKRVHLSEIGTLMIESTSVSLTAYLLNELIAHKIKVIFCDDKHNPSAELVPYYGSHDTSAAIKAQTQWDQETMDLVWTAIIEEKIRKQMELLERHGKSESEMLSSYIDSLQLADESNREGHAAKVYFNALFGMDFSRRAENSINAALDYGYSILLSTFNREIVASGYLTQIGICHTNQFNQFNLSSDLMEPFRPIVDEIVIGMLPETFESEHKIALLQMLQKTVRMGNKSYTLDYAIKRYTKSVLDALTENNVEKLRFYENEL